MLFFATKSFNQVNHDNLGWRAPFTPHKKYYRIIEREETEAYIKAVIYDH